MKAPQADRRAVNADGTGRNIADNQRDSGRPSYTGKEVPAWLLFKSACRRGVLLIVAGLLASVISGYMLGRTPKPGWTYYTANSATEPNPHPRESPWLTAVGSLVLVLLTVGVGVFLITFWHQLSRPKDD